MCEERSSHGNSFPGNKESVERPGCYGAGKGRQEAGSFMVLSGAQDTPLLPEGGDSGRRHAGGVRQSGAQLCLFESVAQTFGENTPGVLLMSK